MKKFFSNPTIRFLLLIAFLAGLWFLGRAFHIDIDQVHAWLARYPLWLSGFLFIAIYVGVTTFLWFGTIDFFRIMAALLFGPYVSAVLVYIGEIFNASILFMISRKLGREFVEQKFHLKEKDLHHTENNAGFWWALALKMNLLVPQRILDLGFGLTKLSFVKYLLAVVLGLPGRILLVQVFTAGVGVALFRENVTFEDARQILLNYFVMHSGVFIFGLANFLVVIVLTIIAIVVSARGRRKVSS